jgi:hypothetical protein
VDSINISWDWLLHRPLIDFVVVIVALVLVRRLSHRHFGLTIPSLIVRALFAVAAWLDIVAEAGDTFLCTYRTRMNFSLAPPKHVLLSRKLKEEWQARSPQIPDEQEQALEAIAVSQANAD